MRLKRHLAWLFILALIFVFSGCSAPATTDSSATDSTSAEASFKVYGLPKNFPDEATNLFLDDAMINQRRSDVDGMMSSVIYTTEKSLDEAKTFYAENMKDFESYTVKPNDFGAVYEGDKGDYGYTVAVTQGQDTLVFVDFTVYETGR